MVGEELQPRRKNFDLVEFIDDKPYGELEPLNNAQNRRPMFGSIKSNCGIHSNENCIWETCTVTHYFFWFVSEVEEDVETDGSKHCVGD